jgi:hypothetical protein
MLPAMKTSADGSLTLYIQNKSPGADKEANWLPAPDGPIYLVMRLYWPKTDPPSILPPGEGTWQPPTVMRGGQADDQTGAMGASSGEKGSGASK